MLYVVIPPTNVTALRRSKVPSIFAVANPKGGSGKTTVAIILAGEFAKHGYSVAIIVDADPQGSSYQWHASSVARGLDPAGRRPRAARLMKRLSPRRSIGWTAIDVVVVDTPAIMARSLMQSALRADLVVLPCKVHTFDASQVVRTIRSLEQHAPTCEAADEPASCSVQRIRQPRPQHPAPARRVVAYLDAEKVPVCSNALYRRVTYRTMTSGHGTLYQMSDKDESVRARPVTTPIRSSASYCAASQSADQGDYAA